MELCFLIVICIVISILFKSIFNRFFTTQTLPPSPRAFHFIGNLLLLHKSSLHIEPILRSLHSKFGPIVTLYIGSRPAIFIADRSLAHQALVQNEALFADRPPPSPISKILSSNQHGINYAFYGPTWCLLRRNLTAEILHRSRVKPYAHARKWVLQILRSRIESQAKSGHPVSVLDHFQFSMFALLVLMCFGDKLDEIQIKKIEEVQRQILLCYVKFNKLNSWPKLTKILMRKSWEDFFQIGRKRKDVLIPLIRARKELKEKIDRNEQDYILSYVDASSELEISDEKRKLNEDEMVSLCSEFLNA